MRDTALWRRKTCHEREGASHKGCPKAVSYTHLVKGVEVAGDDYRYGLLLPDVFLFLIGEHQAVGVGISKILLVELV